MGDDLTDMGSHGGGSDGAQVVLAHHPEHPLAGNTDATTDPKPSPDLAVSLALPGGCLQVGLDGHQQSLVRDRGLRSPALCLGAQRWPAAGISWRRTRNGQNPRPHAGGRRPNPCRERWRHSSPRPPPPQRAGRLRLGLQQFHLHDQLPDPLHGDVQFRLHRIALAFLERGIPAIAFSRHCSSRKISTPNCRDKSSTGSTQKPQGNLTLARHRPPLAKSQRACRRNLARGKRGRAKLALVYHRPINSNFVLKIVGHVPALDTSIKPILCPSRKIGSDSSIGPCGSCAVG